MIAAPQTRSYRPLSFPRSYCPRQNLDTMLRQLRRERMLREFDAIPRSFACFLFSFPHTPVLSLS